MPFFIRNKNKSITRKRKNKSLDIKPQRKQVKNTVVPFTNLHNGDDEIPSDDTEDELTEKRIADADPVEEDFETAQEKKIKLAKKYLEEIEREERERLEEDNQVVNNLDDVLASRLKQDVLEQSGKLQKKIVHTLKEKIDESDITRLRCKEHKLSITCLALSNNGNFLYSGSKDCSIVQWNLSEKKKVGYIKPRHQNKNDLNLHDSTILSLSVSFDNQYLASSDCGNDIRIWKTSYLSHHYTFKGHQGSVMGLIFCKHSNHLYSCSKDRTIRVWSVQDCAYIETLFGHMNSAVSIDILSKDKLVSCGGKDVRVWKVNEESQLIFNTPDSGNSDVVRKLNERNFITGCDDGSIIIWSVVKKKPIKMLEKSHGTDDQTKDSRWINSVAAIPNTEIFATGSNNGYVKIWKFSDNLKDFNIHTEVALPGFLNCMLFTPNEKQLIIGVGQEHKLGRWTKIKDAKNSIVLINITN